MRFVVSDDLNGADSWRITSPDNSAVIPLRVVHSSSAPTVKSTKDEVPSPHCLQVSTTSTTIMFEETGMLDTAGGAFQQCPI